MNTGRSFRVLVADDNQANRALLRAYLRRLGFETVMAEDGLQAVDLFVAIKPDIVLMDVMMPNIDGFEAVRRIRDIPAEHWVPVLVVSAMDAEYDIVRGLEAGADDYLTKPVSYQVFAAKMRTVARALEFQRAREEARRRESAVSDAVIDGIVTFDAMGSILDCNRAATEIFRTSRRDILGLHAAVLLAEEERPRFLTEFREYVDDASGAAAESGFIGRVREAAALDRTRRGFPMELCITELPVTDRRLFVAVVRDISERKRVEQQLAENAGRLQQYHDEAESEAELAKDILERHIRREALTGRGVQHIVIPTQRFSGDVVLAARSPSGRLYGMLADATGHGLAAAMSSLSVVNDFYRAVQADLSLGDMARQLNTSLCGLLPPGRFVSAAMVCLDEGRRQGEVWVGGVPDVLRLDEQGRICERFTSCELPLGITQADDESVPACFTWQSPGQLLLCSDGILEATNAGGQEFGYERISRAIGTPHAENRLHLLREQVTAHLGGAAGHDDMSALLLDLPV